MLLDAKTKEACRVCGRELCGNQRRWLFHPTAKLNLQVLLSHALGRELTRDGRGEFACSKCAFMLDRMYRFDTVIARVEALSVERLQRLLQEKHRLRQCIGGLYRKTNAEEGVVPLPGNEAPGDGMYCALLQEDLVYSLYESWADDGLDCCPHRRPQSPVGPDSEVTTSQRCLTGTPSRCRGCSYLRVADSDYEAVCKVPRKLARSISCGPSTRYSASVIGGSGGEAKRGTTADSEETVSSPTLVAGSQDPSKASDSDRTLAARASSSPSIASIETTEEGIESEAIMEGLLQARGEPLDDRISDSFSEEHMGAPRRQASPGPGLSLVLGLLQSCSVPRPIRGCKGSKLPVLLRRGAGNAAKRLYFPDPVVESSCSTPNGEGDIHLRTPEPETPAIGLEFGAILAEMEDLFREYPPPPPHQV
ncbi:uncharacterized protein [Brachionichthys hirsutus]|uniref:uncharacterized protein n=1 Tax=Brachionichthys hirsutus TaxID=412623 RepID=UPI00360451D4